MGKILRYIAGSNNIDDLGEGIISVPFLPERGQNGKIYKNRQDNEYYLWNEKDSKYDLLSEVTEGKEVNLGQDFKIYYSPIKNNSGEIIVDRYYLLDSVNNKFTKLQTEMPVITEVSDVVKFKTPAGPGQLSTYLQHSFMLDPDVFYDLRMWYYDPENQQGVILNSKSGNWDDGVYSGRISFIDEPLSLQFSPNVIIPGDELNIELNHTYEFNITRGVLLMTDITNQELLDQVEFGFNEIFKVQEDGSYFRVKNLGETKNNPIGDYFAWGELGPKDTFTLENYRFYNDDEYNTYTYDQNSQLSHSDDAAFNALTASTPCDWNMPDVLDFKALLDNCPRSFGSTKINGQTVQTIIFEGGAESLVIPCVGYYNENGLQKFGTEVLLWSHNLNTEDETSGTAKALRLRAAYPTAAEIVDVPRYYGCLVKPIVQ